MVLSIVSQNWLDLVGTFAEMNPTMAPYVASFFPQELFANKNSDLLRHLCFTITYQAIKASICGKMWSAFELLMDELGYVGKKWPSEIVASLTDEQLCKRVKLSKKKADAIRNTAFYLMEYPIDINLPSADLRQQLTKIKGVGEFTANYFLFDQLGRLDIPMHSDLLVRKGLKTIYKLDHVPSVKECQKLVEPWGFLASIGSLICYNVYHYS